MCEDCQDFTAGQFCETCIPLYFRPIGKSKYDPDVCVPCQCSEAGVKGDDLDCVKVSEFGVCFNHKVLLNLFVRAVYWEKIT